MTFHHFCWIASFVCFVLGFANVPAGVNWLCGGLAFAALTQVL